MSNVVSFTGERLTPGQGNAELVEHLRDLATAVEDGTYGPCQMAAAILLDGTGQVRQFNRTTRHFMQTEYLGILDVAKHQVLNDIHPAEPEDADDAPAA